jgi:hypothetical protein
MIVAKSEFCEACGERLYATDATSICVRCALKLAIETDAAGTETYAHPLEPPRRFGDYDLIEEIARGGMGVIWRARQLSVNRIVAIKILLNGKFASEVAIKRFEFEAEAAGNLDHQNIVRIHGAGRIEGVPYICMELIPGLNLSDWLATDRTQDPNSTGAARKIRRYVTILAKIAQAVHFAHLRGVLHRDLKPSNVIVDSAGEPHVVDFGVAKIASIDQRLTCTEGVLGSPYYMAPEQVSGRASGISVGIDVYSLGVMLYELMTGTVPFKGDSPIETLRLAAESEPIEPSLINRSVARDLDTICLKSLSKKVGDRYETAGALADDLERWLRGEPIRGRPVGHVERTLKWMRRHPLKAALAGVTAMAILGPLLSTFYLYNFLLPVEARAHPIVGWDINMMGFSLSLDTGRVDRATMNFDHREFARLKRNVLLYFTNVPPDVLVWSSNLSMQIFADIPAAPDRPRGPVVRPGQWFPVEAPHSHDRAYYVCPFGWDGNDVLARAPNARLVLVGDRGVSWNNK